MERSDEAISFEFLKYENMVGVSARKGAGI
jgi:hypothetical protein